MTTSASRTATAARARRRPAVITLWVLQVLLALMFVVASGAPKLFGEATAVAMFQQIGLGQWFRYLVGVLEVAGGIGLLIPRLAGLAALGLVGVMIGAVVTTFAVLDTTFWYTPVILGVLLAVVVRARREEIRALVRG